MNYSEKTIRAKLNPISFDSKLKELKVSSKVINPKLNTLYFDDNSEEKELHYREYSLEELENLEDHYIPDLEAQQYIENINNASAAKDQNIFANSSDLDYNYFCENQRIYIRSKT